MNPTLHNTARWLVLGLAMAVVAAVFVALACGPAQDGQVGGEVEGTPTPTAVAADTPTPEPTATAVPTDTPTPEPTATAVPTDTPTPEPTPTAAHTDTPTPEPSDTDACRGVAEKWGGLVTAPYRFGSATESAGDGAAGAAESPEPTITVAEFWTQEGLVGGDPPTIEKVAPTHDTIVRGVAVVRTDLLSTSSERETQQLMSLWNFKVSEYWKNTGPEFICVYEHPERWPFKALHQGQEYVLMLDYPRRSYYGGSTYPDVYHHTGVGWRVVGADGIRLATTSDRHNFVITSDRRKIHSIWLTPEPERVWLVGGSISMTELERRVKAVVGTSP